MPQRQSEIERTQLTLDIATHPTEDWQNGYCNSMISFLKTVSRKALGVQAPHLPHGHERILEPVCIVVMYLKYKW